MTENIDWNKVVKELGPRLFKYFCSRFSNEQAEDLVQETLIRLVRKVQKKEFDLAKGTLRMFSFGIAHYVAMENFQRAKDEPLSLESLNDSLVSENMDTETIIFSKEKVEKVRELISQLTIDQQNVLSLFIDKELTINEMAIILNLPIGTIKSHLFRAKQRLIDLLEGEQGSLYAKSRR